MLENRERLAAVVADQEGTVWSGRVLVSLHAGQPVEQNGVGLGGLVGAALSWWRFEPVTGAYDAMVSSGDITAK
jgi:hypothetical protein